MSHAEFDPYTAKAQNDDVTPQQKITDLHTIVKSTSVGMMTSRAADGSLHSRAMAPAGLTEPTEVNLIFIANKASWKFDEITNDPHVNVSFYEHSSTNWASYSGQVKVITDKSVIKKHWNPLVSAWFGDLGDGLHKGDESDPRVVVIELVPDEVRYWISKSSKIGRAIDVAVGAMTGKTAVPGELRTITKAEIQLTQGLHSKAA
ncbi:hypothetical protein K488DRAFT_75701 [Vararia minispora EC-137]|uniref:Uncharacterized protein n=1 Tax=Vararia minispora EC-137 TaxID=1314806 RepID=A0ACB8R073_9AGAM|nr:hypothetical protein K488DRAFT_75701 [Vararia minispora EC-137]